MREATSIGATFRIAMLMALMLIGPRPAFAWDGVVSGTIVAVDVTGGNNYGFRVFVSGVTNMCGTGSNWAYLNESDSNYKTYVAAILAAKAQGNSVTVFSTVVSGYCQIGYISVH
jgi:hypothetical protein